MNNGRRSERWALWHRRRLYNQANKMMSRGFNMWNQYRLMGVPFVSRRLNHSVQIINRHYAPAAVLERHKGEGFGKVTVTRDEYRETAYSKIPDMCYEMIDGVITPIK